LLDFQYTHADFEIENGNRCNCDDCVRRLTQRIKIMKKFYYLRSFQMMHGTSVAVAIFIASCAGIPAPTEQMAVSKVAVSNATSAGGNEFAPLQLKSAMEKMDSAERAMAAENYLQARQLAEQAQVDAQLAATTARSAKAQKAAGALQEDNRVLRQEINRNAQ
jgi:Domain of unknown function (DUF4398)